MRPQNRFRYFHCQTVLEESDSSLFSLFWKNLEAHSSFHELLTDDSPTGIQVHNSTSTSQETVKTVSELPGSSRFFQVLPDSSKAVKIAKTILQSPPLLSMS
jgi:hypothetical protein